MKNEIVSHSPDDLIVVAERLIKNYPDRRIFAFYGEMGAGKTTFIKAICKYLNVEDIVSSPTFAIINEYLSSDNKRIFHFDFYRLKNTAELFDIGYEDYFFSNNYCLIEWPEKIEGYLPEDTIRVNINVDRNKNTRLITF
jgi:tRNA threonylcarbamoyladenosine biosynthesis protein TsaE